MEKKTEDVSEPDSNKSTIDENSEDQDAKIERHHQELNADESVVSLTDLLEAASREDAIAR